MKRGKNQICIALFVALISSFYGSNVEHIAKVFFTYCESNPFQMGHILSLSLWSNASQR